MRMLIILAVMIVGMCLLMIGESIIDSMTERTYTVEAVKDSNVMVFNTTDTTGLRDLFYNYQIKIK